MSWINLEAKAKRIMLVPAYAGLLTVSPATAQAAAAPDDTAADIVVTARKVAEPLLGVPLSVTSIAGQTITDAGLQSIADMLRYAPDVAIGGGIAGQLQGQISIRGISTLVRNIGLESGVGIYVDGVFVGRPENFSQHLLDIDRVEILRGPQNTEYGKNTIAGVISVESTQPDAATGGYAEVSGGNYDHVGAEAAYGGKLSDTLSARGAVSYIYQDGFYRNVSGGKNTGSVNLLSWRLAAKFAPMTTLSFTLRGDGLHDRGTPGFFQADALIGYPASFPGNQPLHTDNNRPDSLARNDTGVSLTGNWSASSLSVVSITAWRHSRYNAALDDDQEQVDYVAADNFADHSNLVTQELRATGKLGHVDYLIGGYYLNQTVATSRALAIGAGLGFPGDPALATIGEVKTAGRAVFARLDYQLVAPLHVSAGLRYTDERKQAQFTQFDASGIFSLVGFPDLHFTGVAHNEDVSPNISASLKVAHNIDLYGRFAQGFKSAAFNVDIASSLAGLTAQPEKASSYEAGIKLLADHSRVSVDVAAFRTDYDRLQVSQLLGSGLSLTNAGKAVSQGIESEFTVQSRIGLRVEANAAFLDAHYTDFANCGIPASLGGGIADCRGKDLVLAPHFSGHAAMQYETPTRIGEFRARADLDYRSTVFFEPTNSPAFAGAARTLLNVRISLRRGRWEETAWVENLTNAIYKTYADDRSALGVLRTAAYGAPRTFGVTFRSPL